MSLSPVTSGRPSKFTPATRARLVVLIGKGVPFCHAAAAVGISHQTLLNWRKENEDFALEIEQAVAIAIEKRLDVIERASALDPSCAKWQLEHLHPQHFARQRVEISGPEGVPLQLQPLVIAVHVSEPQMKGAAFSPTNPQPLLVPGPSTINAPQSNVGKAIAIVARPVQKEIQQPSEVKSAIVTPAAPPPRRFAVRQNTPVPLSAAEAFLERLEARSNGPLPPPPPPPKPTPLSPQELARQAATLDDLEKQLAELK